MSALRIDPESPNKRLARHVLSLRKARGLSQEALAELASMHPTWTSQIEHGEPNVSAEIIQALATALGVDPSDLFAPN